MKKLHLSILIGFVCLCLSYFVVGRFLTGGSDATGAIAEPVGPTENPCIKVSDVWVSAIASCGHLDSILVKRVKDDTCPGISSDWRLQEASAVIKVTLCARCVQKDVPPGCGIQIIHAFDETWRVQWNCPDTPKKAADPWIFCPICGAYATWDHAPWHAARKREADSLASWWQEMMDSVAVAIEQIETARWNELEREWQARIDSLHEVLLGFTAPLPLTGFGTDTTAVRQKIEQMKLCYCEYCWALFVCGSDHLCAPRYPHRWPWGGAR